jgi:CBS domain-containing protein
MHAIDASLTARDVMSTDVLTVTEDLTVRELARFLIEHEISGAPVVGRRGRLVGIVSVADVVRATAEQGLVGGKEPRVLTTRPPETLEMLFAEEQAEETPVEEEMADEELADEEPLRVADIMSTRVLTVPPETPIDQLARAMLQARYHRLLVTAAERIVGVVSSMDLVRVLADRSAAPGRIT